MSQVIINDVPPRTQAYASGGQTIFGTNWTANYPSDVIVYSRATGVDADDFTQILSYPSQYSVTFVGALQEVQVELVNPSTLGDIVTITRMTPADRENLYSNTNFLPSMLNNDFGILTLVDQQAQLVDQLIGPRYNYSAIIIPLVDTILPILPPNCGWVKNDADTEIIPMVFPSGGLAPADATYVTVTDETADLPNSLPLSSIGSGILINDVGSNTLLARSTTGTADEITVVNGDGLAGNINIGISDNPIIPGTAGMGIPEGTTAQRVIPAVGIGLRYNTDNQAMEYWDGVTWVELVSSGSLVSPQDIQGNVFIYGVDTGVLFSNAYEVTLNPAPLSYYDGLGVLLVPGYANSGASTLNANGLGAAPILINNATATAGSITTPINLVYNTSFGGWVPPVPIVDNSEIAFLGEGFIKASPAGTPTLTWQSTTTINYFFFGGTETGNFIIPVTAGSLDITTNGANGLDTGTVAANSAYEIFVISDSAGVSPNAAVAVLQGTPITYPVGYDISRQFAMIATDGSANIVKFYQTDTAAGVYTQVISPGLQVLTAGNATTRTALVMTPYQTDPAVAGDNYNIINKFIFYYEFISSVAGNSFQLSGDASASGDKACIVSSGVNAIIQKGQVEVTPNANFANNIVYLVTDALDSLTLWLAAIEYRVEVL